MTKRGSNGRADRPTSVTGESAAIYCRISKADDDDQTGVDRQERICREIGDRLGLVLDPRHIFIDNSRSAWQRNRKRPGWDRLLDGARDEEFRHVIAYHPDRLMRQPRDLEELLQVADDHRIMLHGEANRRDLSDPDDRFILRIEVAHACRSSDDTSRRLKDALLDRLDEGKPHGGRRRYGYEPGGLVIRETEASVVREIFDRFLRGESPGAIARGLVSREVPTAEGKNWTAYAVRAVLDLRHCAGILVHNGEEVGTGNWPTIIDLGTWEEARAMRGYRSAASGYAEKRSRARFYLLRGLVVCGACGSMMSGQGKSGGHAEYQCSRSQRFDEKRCMRNIAAGTLEDYVRDVAIEVLENLAVDGRPTASVMSEGQAEALEVEQQQLGDLNGMWTAREITTGEYRQMRKTIEERITKLQRRTVVRPLEILNGVTGPDARAAWFSETMTDERRNAVLRFLISAVIIGPVRKRGRIFDYGRVEIEPNDLG